MRFKIQIGSPLSELLSLEAAFALSDPHFNGSVLFSCIIFAPVSREEEKHEGRIPFLIRHNVITNLLK